VDLIYGAICSLDGYVNDEHGDFDWAAPDEEVHAHVNDLERPVGTYLYGRRMYEVMRVWETMPIDDESAAMRDYTSLWRAADKVVFSSTLPSVTTARTRLERSFDPATVRSLKATATRPLSIGGPTLAAAAFAHGLVDEVHLYVNPVVVGGGTRALPDGERVDLTLVDEHRFAGGVVHLAYRVTS
jgi:dihydrofolate reductase